MAAAHDGERRFCRSEHAYPVVARGGGGEAAREIFRCAAFPRRDEQARKSRERRGLHLFTEFALPLVESDAVSPPPCSLTRDVPLMRLPLPHTPRPLPPRQAGHPVLHM